MPWTAIVDGSGVDEATIRRVAERYIAAKSAIACWAMGLTQHKHAVVTIQEIVNVMLLRGNIGRPGAGLCPVRGHSNVQGDRTMGIDHAPRAAFLDALGAAFGFEPPRAHGLDTVASIQAMERRDVQVFVALGGNFVSATPDTDRTARALESCRMTASVSTKVNRTHLHPGRRALILPCLGRTEIDLQGGAAQFVTVEDSMSIVHRSQGVLPPASPELRSEPAIVAQLGEALIGPRVPCARARADTTGIRDVIGLVVPGFGDFTSGLRAEAASICRTSVRERTVRRQIGGRARFTLATPPDSDAATRRLLIDDDPQPRPVQHDDLRSTIR